MVAGPQAKWQVFIDFDNDSDYTDAIEDVTADVQMLKRVHTRNIVKHRFPAAVLEMKLKNDDHKYSPTNTSSAIYPFAWPGPQVWVFGIYPCDDFTGTNGDTLASRKPTYDDTFAAWAGDTSRFDIQSNKLATKTAGNYTAVLEFNESDCYVGAIYTRGGSANSGLVCRWSDASNYILVYHEGTNLRVGKVEAGTLTVVATTVFVWGTEATKRLIVELHGEEIRVSVDQTLLLNTTSTFNQTATKHGIGGRSTHADDRWENFGGMRPVFQGRIDALQPRPEVHNQYTYIRAMDDFERFGNHVVMSSAPTGGTNTEADDILGYILDAVDFSSANRIMDTGTNLTQDEDHEKAMTRNALTEIYQVMDDDVGLAFMDGQGHFRYEGAKRQHPDSGGGGRTLDHRERAPHTASIRTWRSDRAAGDNTDIEIASKFVWDDGKDRVENEVYYIFHRISRTAATMFWRLEVDDKPWLANGTTQEFLALGDGDQVADPRPPLPVSDITFNAAADDSGTNLLTAEGSELSTVTLVTTTLDDAGRTSANSFVSQGWNDGNHVIWMKDNTNRYRYAFIGTEDVDGDGTKIKLYSTHARTVNTYAYTDSAFDVSDTPITYSVYDVWTEIIDGFDGNFIRVKIHNGSGTDGYITKLLMIGTKGTKSSKTAARAEDTASQSTQGRRRVSHETLHTDRFGDTTAGDRPTVTADAGSAFERATKRVALYGQPREKVQCQMYNLTQANLMQILHRSVSDRVRLIGPSGMGIDAEYFIEGLNILVDNGGLRIDADWLLEQAIGQSWGKFYWTATGASNAAQWA